MAAPEMEIQFWGVRGSMPVPGHKTVEYGGNTSCVEVRCGGQTFILDAGTGISALSRAKDISDCHILLSHTHIDHIQGLPLFLPLYRSGQHVHIWAGHLEGNSIQSVLGRMMSSPLFPLSLDAMKADISYHDFTAGEALEQGDWDDDISIRTFRLHHPDVATGYRISHAGRSVCYITDYEHDNVQVHDQLAEFVRGCDCLIYDATFTDENYIKYKGWGHSTWQAAVTLANRADVAQLVLFHHDPEADDHTLHARETEAISRREATISAREGMVISLSGDDDIDIFEPTSVEDHNSLALIDRLTHIGTALSSQQDVEKLLEMILLEAADMAHADGGTLYLCDDTGENLEYSIMRNHSMNIAYGGSADSPPPIPPISLNGQAAKSSMAAHCVLKKKIIHVENVYEDAQFDFSGAKKFDQDFDYHTHSLLAVPMMNHKGEVLGCLQLINAQDTATGKHIPFSPFISQLVQSLASQAAIILDNKMLIQGQKDLLEAFIKMIAKAIDAKSPYTGAHCERVPTLTNMLAQAADEATDGVMKDFSLNEEEKYELHIAGWMHDCGKIVTPVHVIDKSTKLETIWDRIHMVMARFDIVRAQKHAQMLEACLQDGADQTALKERYAQEMKQLDADAGFIQKTNIGGEFMRDEDLARLKEITEHYHYRDVNGQMQPVISEEEHYNLQTRRGTLTHEERTIMNDHMVHTCNMLDALPFPKHLRRVPEYAGGHHERMDGKGYPKGLLAGEMSIPARMMAVADVFEALTAADRPYKPAKPLSETMTIIGKMKEQHHLDPMIVDFFITSKVYLAYAQKYLTPDLIDAVDEEALLAITPAARN